MAAPSTTNDARALDGARPSRASRILACAPAAGAESVGAGDSADGLTVAELRRAYTEATGEPAPASFGAEVGSLVRRGYLRAVGGRAGRTRYARAAPELRGAPGAEPEPVGAASPGVVRPAPADAARTLDADDFARAVLDALACAQAQAGGRDVPAVAVVDAVLVAAVRDGRGAAETEPGVGEPGRAALAARVRSTLGTLARARERGPDATRGPMVVCAPDPHTRRPRWRLAGTATRTVAPDGACDAAKPSARGMTDLGRAGALRPRAAHATVHPTAHATRTAAAVEAFAEAGRELGRPASLRETAWYLDRPGGPARTLHAQDVAAACRTVLRRSRVSDGHGMARACFAADRYAAAPVVASTSRECTIRSADGMVAASLVDGPIEGARDLPDDEREILHDLGHALDAAVERLAASEEAAGLARLSARAARWQTAGLVAFLGAREAASAAAVEPALAAVAGQDSARRAAALTDAIAASERACDVLDAWIDAARGAGISVNACAARRHAVAAHRAHLRVCGPLAARAATPTDEWARGSAGESQMPAQRTAVAEATTADLAPYARAAATLAGVPATAAARLYARARRVGGGRRGGSPVDPTADPHGASQGRPTLGPAQPATVDRVDALALLVEATTARRARALVREAVGLLGAAVRDADAVRALLAALPVGDAATRYAGVVALGLLGHVPAWNEAAGSTPSPLLTGTGAVSDAIAFALGVALANPDVRAAQAALQAARPLVAAHARGVLDTARARVGAGLWLTAAE